MKNIKATTKTKIYAGNLRKENKPRRKEEVILYSRENTSEYKYYLSLVAPPLGFAIVSVFIGKG